MSERDPTGPLPMGLARTALDEDGMVRVGNLPESVAQSWERCVGLGLDTSSRQVFESLTSRELAEIIERNQRLTHQAVPAMASLYEQIRNTRCMVVLTDAQGLILHSLGDDDFMEKAQRVALQPGVCWDERSKGTNAIGTALFENRALEVCGSEHFFRANSFLTCSATPIRAPGGATIGALDVSGDHRGHQSHTLALVKMTAQTIENHLSFDAYPGAIEMRFHSRPEFIGTLCEGLALLDPQGRVLTANRSAEFQLDIPLAQLIGQSFDDIFDRRFVQALAHPGRTVELLTHRGVRVVAMIAAPQAAARQTRTLARPRREGEEEGRSPARPSNPLHHLSGRKGWMVCDQKRSPHARLDQPLESLTQRRERQEAAAVLDPAQGKNRDLPDQLDQSLQVALNARPTDQREAKNGHDKGLVGERPQPLLRLRFAAAVGVERQAGGVLRQGGTGR